MPRHRHPEWLKFLRVIDRRTPKGKQLHLIVDNYRTHNPSAGAAMGRASQSASISTSPPTAGSWLNMVERFFRDLTQNQLRRGIFLSVEQLQQTILAYIEQHNRQPKPFIWTAKASDILEKVKRGRAILKNSTSA